MSNIEALKIIENDCCYECAKDCGSCAYGNAISALRENDELFYKLIGVMHFVDKWLEEDELNLDEVQRADLAREKALEEIEKYKNYI